MTKKEIIDKLESIEKDVNEIREYLSQTKADTATNVTAKTDFKQDYTLEDLYREFGSKVSLAQRLRTALQRRNINTLEEFLSLSPGELLELDNVGYTTLVRTKKALNKLGIKW